MCGIRSKIFLLLLAVLLLQPCSLFSDVVLTDQEATQLKTSLKTAKKELSEQQKQIAQLQNQLSEQQSELKNARAQLQISQNETKELQNNLTKLSTSWKQQKKEARWGKVKAFAIGAVLGAAGGFAGAWYMLK